MKKWEEICDGTYRLKVPGGWLIKSVPKIAVSPVMVFVKDNSVLLLRIELEALITEREGMIAENKQRERLGQSMAYTEDNFAILATRIKALSSIPWPGPLHP